MLTPPPDIDAAQAAQAAERHYGWRVTCTPLSGERDRNFLLKGEGRPPIALKFINPSESQEETDLQVCGLAFLAQRDLALATPTPLKTRDGGDGFVVQTARGLVRGRAYTYLEGQPAVTARGGPGLRHSVGAAVGRLGVALRDFRHEVVSRVFLWDLMHVGKLAAFAQHVDDIEVRAFVTGFVEAFSCHIESALGTLPAQFIHADFSKSNLLVSPQDDTLVTGVLDFGDMVHAPRIADLAIAASYQISDSPDPVAALSEVAAGYLSVCELLPQELAHLLDLVVARLAQRLVLTGWRASHFPENKAYILRSQPDALRLMRLLIPVWHADFRRRHPAADLPRSFR